MFAFLSESHDSWAMTETTLGQRIKRLREQHRWTQEQLGDLVGVSTKTVSNWERGRNDPRASIGALEAVFKAPLDNEAPADDPVVAAVERSRLISWRQRAVISEYERHLHEQGAENERWGSA